MLYARVLVVSRLPPSYLRRSLLSFRRLRLPRGVAARLGCGRGSISFGSFLGGTRGLLIAFGLGRRLWPFLCRPFLGVVWDWGGVAKEFTLIGIGLIGTSTCKEECMLAYVGFLRHLLFPRARGQRGCDDV